MIALLLAMYPARWRRRYAEEFRAVLESRPLGPFDVADVLLGALDARLTPLRLAGAASDGGGPLMLLRMGGFGAIIGPAAWLVGIAGASRAEGDDAVWSGVIIVGNLALLLALVGLSSFQARHDAVLVWSAFAIPAIGSVVAIVGAFGLAVQPAGGPFVASWAPWDIWIVGALAMVVGSAIFAFATIRATVLSRRSAQALALSSVAVVALALIGVGFVEVTPLAQVALLPSLLAFAASWAGLGLSALRRGPIRAAAAA